MGWQDAPVVTTKAAWMDAPEVGAKPEKSQGERIGRQVLNAGAGALRGAGSIGATVMRVLPNALGGDTADENAQRRKSMDEALGSMGADTDSLAYGGGKLAAEIAGTAGAGGLLAKGVSAIPGAAAAAPNLINAIRTSGMTTGAKVAPGFTNALADMGVRALGGMTTGGVSAGMVNPADAGMGALVGGLAPGVIQAAGAAGNKLASIIRGPEQGPEMIEAIKAARDAGYVIPPTQAKPSLGNRMLEGYAGKLTTAQNASAKNAEITDSLAAKALGLAPDAKISPEVLQDIRKNAGQAYEAISGAGTITPGPAYSQALDKIAEKHVLAANGFPGAKPSPVIDMVESLKSPSFDASSAVAKIKELRTAADDGFRTGNTDIARASKQAAQALEDAVEQNLVAAGNPKMLQDFRDARTLIAKTYTVEKALNKTTGTVDARKLGQQIERGKPLTDELKTAGDFANRFKKAAQTPETMGSLPGNSPLDYAFGAAASAAHGNLLPLAGAVVGRPIARSAALSGMVQNRLINSPQSQNKLVELLQSPEGQQLMYRLAPQMATSRQ